MSKYIVPEEMLDSYRHFIDAVLNTELSNIPISITNSFTLADGRKIVFTLEAKEDKEKKK